MYYNRDQEEGSLQNLETPPFNFNVFVPSPSSFADPTGTAGGTNPFPFAAPKVGSTINWADYGEEDLNAVSSNYSVPYVYNFNLNVQRELPSNIRLQVGYVGSVGHRLVLVYEGDPNPSFVPAIYYPAGDQSAEWGAVVFECRHSGYGGCVQL